MATVNMVLDLPVVSSTPGPTWATKINAALELVDAHDHSSGKGVKVTQAGINITGDLEFNANKATELDGLVFVSRGSDLADNNSLYVNSGEVWFRDGTGALVQITASGRVNGQIVGDFGLAGVDAEVRYTDSTKLFRLMADLASGDPLGLAHLRLRDLRLTGRLNLESAANGNVQTVAGNVSLDARAVVVLVNTAAARTITLPAASAGARVVFIKDSTGQANTNAITLDRAAGGNIDGLAANRLLRVDWGAWMLISDGTNWFIA
jgi:hypothetical protein